MEFRQAKLSNGLEVIAEIHPAALTASYGIFVNTGARDEQHGVAGVSHFLEHMVFKGTQTRSAAQVNLEFDRIGASANAYTSEERTVYHATVLPEFQKPVMDLLCDLMSPVLDAEEFRKEKDVVLEEIAMYDDQPPYGGFEKAMEMYFGSHPLSARVLGTYDSVSGMTVEQMREYHQLRYATGNMIVCATGNVDFDRLVEQVQLASEHWPVGTRIRENFEVAIHPTAAVMQHPAACQNYWIRISPGPSRRDNDRYAMRLLATILGDETGSRIFWELIDTGLAEGAALYCQEFDDVGLVQASLCAGPEEFEAVQEVLVNVIHSGVTVPPSQEELEQAFHKIHASIVLASERSSNRLFTVGSAWLSRRAWETADEIIARYRAVTLNDIQRVAEQYLKQPAISLLVCGEK